MPVIRLRLPSLALVLGIPALAALVVYLPTLPGGFLSDDYSQIHVFFGADAQEVAARVGRTFVSGVGPPSNQYRPLTMASFAANLLASGADPAAWRLTNVLLHAANAALVALLAWQLATPWAHAPRAAALVAGLAFAWFAPVRRGGRMDRRPLRRDGAVLDARRRVRVHGEPRVARPLRGRQPRCHGARVHEQGVGGHRVGADRRPRLGEAAGRRRLAAWRRARDRRRVAVARGRRGVFRVPRVDLRRPHPLLSGDLAGRRAAVRKVARRAAGERRLVAARAARDRSTPRLRRRRPPARHRGRLGRPARARRAARARGHRAGVPRGARPAVLALGLVGDR